MASEFVQLLNYLRATCGDAEGRAYYEHWLNNTGLDDNMPMILQKAKGLVFRTMPHTRHDLKDKVQNQFKFEIIDPVNHVVGGYAATPLTDCDGDSCDLDAIVRAGKDYLDRGSMAFAYHRNEPAGDILMEYRRPSDGKLFTTHFDKVGWFVITRLTKKYWDKVQKGAINAYSVGWRKWVYHPKIEGLVVDLEFDDLSVVPYPCNPLCFFQRLKGVDASHSSLFEDIRPNIEKHLKIGGTAKLKALSSCFCKTQSGTCEDKDKHSKKEEIIMSEINQFEVAKTELIKKYPDDEERIKGVATVADLFALTKELEEAASKPKGTEEEFTALLKRRDELAEKNLMKRLRKEVADQEEAAESTEREDRLDKVNKEIGELKVKMDELTQGLGKIKGLSTRIEKMESETTVKGSNPLNGTEETPTLFNLVQAADLQSDPLALQKIGSSLINPEEAA